MTRAVAWFAASLLGLAGLIATLVVCAVHLSPATMQPIGAALGAVVLLATLGVVVASCKLVQAMASRQ